MSLPRGWFAQLLHYLPTRYHDDAVVAGGFIVSPQEAGDIDLWVPAGDHAPAVFCEVANHLIGLGVITQPPTDPDAVYGLHLVATVPNVLLGKDLQVLVTEAENAQQLVDSFDLSCHQMGISRHDDEAYRVWFGRNWTGRSEVPRVTRWSTPDSTYARLHKLCARYGHEPHPDDLAQFRRLAQALANAA